MCKFEGCFLKKTDDKCFRKTSVIVQLFLSNMFCTLYLTPKLWIMSKLNLHQTNAFIGKCFTFLLQAVHITCNFV